VTGIGTFIVVCYSTLILAAVALCYFLMRGWRWKWVAIAPMLLGVGWLAYAPNAEERDIKTRFAELCKDAGVKIVRKVEVDGFYDDTIPNGLEVVSPQGAAVYEKQGFRFYEYRFSRNAYGKQILNPELRVVRYEKERDKWTGTLLKEPLARYHFTRLRYGEAVGYKISATEYAIIDSQTGETVAREIKYTSWPNQVDLWWMSMLGNPARVCPVNRPKRLTDDVFIAMKKKG